MILYIDTTNNKDVLLRLLKDKNVLAEVSLPAERRQSEELLPGIEQFLENNNFKLSDIKSIEVNNAGSGFTSLRIGVVTANALGYALGIPVSVNREAGSVKRSNKFDVVIPLYDREPDIT